MQQIQYIKTNQLHDSGMNPRKEFDQDSIDQLAESIKQVGILQPIIARLNTTVKKKQIPIYEVICGARRLSAAAIAELEEVPVIVRELTDEEAFDLMITENLQRKDVSPLEEAIAYQSLINKGTYDVGSLSIRFGKSESYIRHRIKLNDLISEFKDLLRKEVINLSAALEIAKLNQDNQIDLYNEKYIDKDRFTYWQAPSLKELKRYIDNNYMLNLSEAPFSLEDSTLGPFGSCIGCQFNTASETLLFPDSPEHGKCINITCFKEKKNRHIEREIQRVQDEEPDIIIGMPGYVYGEDETRVKELKKQGVPIVETSWTNGFRELAKPEPPEQPDPDNYDDPEDYSAVMEDYNEELKEYENDLKEYNEKIASGTMRKVFMAAGSDKGKILYYEAVGSRADGIEVESGAEIGVKEQIKELEAKEKRNAEIAFEKTYTDAKELLSNNVYSNIERELTPLEWRAVYIVLLDSIGLVPLKDELTPKGIGYIDSKQKGKIVANLDINQINRLFRAFLQNKLDTSTPNYYISESQSLVEIAKECFPEQVKEIELKHQGVYLKRKESIEKKIKELSK